MTDSYSEYLSANGGARSDTFMGREGVCNLDAGRRVARAVVRARAALEAIATLDGSLAGQPLAVNLCWEKEWLRRRPSAMQAAFVTSRGVFLAAEADDATLMAALGAVLAGGEPRAPLREVPLDAAAATDAVVAIAVGDQPEGDRHVHRRAWTRGGGPWLGVGDTPSLEVVTTCHLGIDGYGHARVADLLFAAEDRRGDLDALAAAAGVCAPSMAPDAPEPLCEPWSVAVRHLPGRAPRFVDAAYAFGSVLIDVYGPGATFQVPVAPGDAADPQRRRGRVVHGLLGLRRGEDRDALARRLPAWLARQRAGRGALALLSRAAAAVPLPQAWRRRVLTGGRGSPLAVRLAGRGCLSMLRFVEGETPGVPLVAASMPSLDGACGGGVVLTVIEHAAGTTATMTHTGPRGRADGMLAEWALRAQNACFASPVRSA